MPGVYPTAATIGRRHWDSAPIVCFRQTVDSYTLSVNTYVIGEAVARYVFGIDDSSKSSAGIEILTNDLVSGELSPLDHRMHY